jgi:hypothetical protein
VIRNRTWQHEYSGCVLWSAERDGQGERADTAGNRRRYLRFLIAVSAASILAATAAVAVGVIGSSKDPEAGVRPAGTPIAKTQRFEVQRALRTTRMQTEAGPRPAGSKTLRSVAEKLRAALPEGRFEAVPGHPGLRNIVGSVGGTGPVLVIASHYDTLSYPKGSIGANNAAAAVGAVVELARIAKSMRRPVGAQGIRFVLFDGEQSPSPNDDDFYDTGLRGSKAYVRAHAEEVQALVLLDYVANKNLRLPREGTSDPELWRQVRASAERVGVGRVFPDRVGESILDDTTPFQQAGIPTVNFIDWTDPHRHKLTDTYDKLSAASLDAVGETVAQLIVDRDRRAQPATP